MTDRGVNVTGAPEAMVGRTRSEGEERVIPFAPRAACAATSGGCPA
jgi:hypothetical protein